jgi:hypothetical protein
MKDVAGPTKPQLDAICAAGAPSIKRAFRQMALSMQGRGVANFDPGREMTKALSDAARHTLTAEQFAKYQKELDARSAAHKRLCVLNLAAMIDRAMWLRPDQREKVTEVLTANWNEAWGQMRMYTYNGRYFPPIPAEILPLLTEAQKSVWETIPKREVNFGWWGGSFDDGDIDVDGADAIIDAAIDR